MTTIPNFNRALIIFFAFIAAMIFARIMYSGSLRFIFLTWNIFLAWIPYMLSCFFREYAYKARWKLIVLAATWLLFFPNALYIVTDLIHLEVSTNVPLWYDAVLLFASSFVGLILAFVSLRKFEMILHHFTQRWTNVIITFILFIGSFGVYLGRFQRWNSWDVVHDPFALAIDIALRFMFPGDHIKTWAVTILLTALYALLYFFMKLLPAVFAQHRRTIPDRH